MRNESIYEIGSDRRTENVCSNTGSVDQYHWAPGCRARSTDMNQVELHSVRCSEVNDSFLKH